MRRRRKKKISMIQLVWKMLVVLSLALNLLAMNGRVRESFFSMSMVERWHALTLCDGIRYRINKYWNISI